MAKNVGSFLKYIRISSGGKGTWSLRSVAARAGISDAYLSQLENGKIKQPLPAILKSLSVALHVPYEEMLIAAGYVSDERKNPELTEIPVYRKKSSSIFFSAKEDPDESLFISRRFIKARNCFAINIKGNDLADSGISDGDTIIIALDAPVDNGDTVLVKLDNEFSVKKFYTSKHGPDNKEKIILQHCNGKCDPIVIDARKKNFELIGKMVNILKAF